MSYARGDGSILNATTANNVCSICLRLLDVPNDDRTWHHVACERDGLLMLAQSARDAERGIRVPA